MKRFFPALLLIVLLLALGSRRLDATAPAAARASAPAAQEAPAGYQEVAENDTFVLYANPETLAFKVLDKRNDYIWHSNLDEVADEDGLNRTWTAFATSGVSINYRDLSADDDRASITRDDHTIDFNALADGFEATLTFEEPSISLLVRVLLEPAGVRVEVPFASLQEADPEYRLGQLHLYPFFGATREADVPGYMFVPDGAGTLINFAAETKARNPFYGRYYGADLGMLSSLPFDPTLRRPHQISIPVTGMVHGNGPGAYVAIVESGAPYAELQAHPAGVITRFNFIYNTFIYNQSYFQATNRSGAGVTVLQPNTNAFDVVVRYRLLADDDADYVGMARAYQSYLLENGLLPNHIDPGGDIGIRLEFLGAEKERILFWYRSLAITTIDQMAGMIAELNVRNPEVVYYGWQPRGADSMYPTSLRLDRSLGTVGRLADFADELAADNGRLYLYVDPQAALIDAGGYSSRHDLSYSITNQNLVGYNRWKVNYYLNAEALSERYRALSADVAETLDAGLAVDGLSYTLYSDFRDDTVLNREQAIQHYQTLVAETPATTAFYTPNHYMFPDMQAYYDMPLTESGYLYTSSVVPFLQIALAGYVPMYGPPLNFSSNIQADLVRHVDFGVYPSYFLTELPTAEFLDTSSGWIFSSSFEQWREEIDRSYEWLNTFLAPVKGEQIVAREILGPGIVATTYSNGQQIVVNHGSAPYTEGALFIGPQNAIIREVEP